jgi:hypothetical protein
VFFLLPGAERNRKKLLTVFAVVLLCAQAYFPLPLIDSAVNAVCGPLMQPVTRLAGTWSALFQRLPAGSETTSEHSSPLIAAERKFGHPRDVPGVVWLEVPVLDIDTQSGQMKLGAGNDFHLSPGQVVAFADSFLGRIAEVNEDIAYVDLFNRAGQRTGITLQSEGVSTRAVCFGRGLSGAAVINWIENEKSVTAESNLWWRPRPLDTAELANAGLKLGQSATEGSSARGDYTFVVDHPIPASAEGRVYVAASAVGDSIVSEPLIFQASAQRVLLGDAVFGGRMCAVTSSADFQPAVLSDHSLVCGKVVAWRGNWGWAYLQQPSAWIEKSVSLVDGAVRLHSPENDASNPILYTRGGEGVPRGMLLGESQANRFVPSASLEVWLAPQSLIFSNK